MYLMKSRYMSKNIEIQKYYAIISKAEKSYFIDTSNYLKM